MSSWTTEYETDGPVISDIKLPGPTAEPPPSPASDFEEDYSDETNEARLTSIHSSLSTLLFNEKYSDMTIRCCGREFKAHRAVVCPQSPFFDRAFGSSFKEAISQSIDLPDDNPDILALFLEFLYTGIYTDGVIPPQGGPSTAAMMTAVEVQDALGNPPGVECNSPFVSIQMEAKYRPPRRKEQEAMTEPEEEYNEFQSETGGDSEEDEAEKQWREQSNPLTAVELAYPNDSMIDQASTYRNVLARKRNDLFRHLRLYIMADKYDVPALKLLSRDRFYRAAEVVWADDDLFPEVIDEIYSCTLEIDTSLRDIVCRLVGSQIEDDEVRDKMREVMKKHGEFATGVLEYRINSSRMRWR